MAPYARMLLRENDENNKWLVLNYFRLLIAITGDSLQCHAIQVHMDFFLKFTASNLGQYWSYLQRDSLFHIVHGPHRPFVHPHPHPP